MASLIAQLAVGTLMGGFFTAGALATQAGIEEAKKAVSYIIEKTTPPPQVAPITRDPELDRLYTMQRYNNLKHILKNN